MDISRQVLSVHWEYSLCATVQAYQAHTEIQKTGNSKVYIHTFIQICLNTGIGIHTDRIQYFEKYFNNDTSSNHLKSGIKLFSRKS